MFAVTVRDGEMNTKQKPKKRVLIAEDDPVSCHLLKNFLVKWDYDVLVVTDGIAALRILESEDTPRLAVLDWMMPGMEGVQICQRIRERKDHPYVYVLLLTGRSEKQDLLHALEVGADDYLTKPFDAQELRARLLVGERILNLQDDLITAQDELRFRATHDALTGLANRATVMDALRAELFRQTRESGSFGIVMVDIDHFKKVNDTYGHLCGDEVLRAVAGRMKDCVRPYDTVGRYGGEEFLIVVSGSDAMGVMATAERLRGKIESQPVSTQVGEIPLTVSLGVAVSPGPSSLDPQVLLRLADDALYRAKANGRNRSELANSDELVTPVSTVSENIPSKSGHR
jgi:two-component system, cell cycle response regulator